MKVEAKECVWDSLVWELQPIYLLPSDLPQMPSAGAVLHVHGLVYKAMLERILGAAEDES